MKSQALRKTLTAGLITSLLSASIALAADEPRNSRATAQPARSQQTARQQVPFQSDRTDSWLCTHVSVFFCSNLFPTLTPSNPSNSATTASNVPDRSRHD